MNASGARVSSAAALSARYTAFETFSESSFVTLDKFSLLRGLLALCIAAGGDTRAPEALP